jgi:lipid-A-disaccharide synthase
MSELEHMGEPFLRAAGLIAEKLGDVTFLVPAVTREARDFIERMRQRLKLDALRIQVLFGHAHAAIGAADVVLVASGTATLEAALIGRPMIIAYRMPKLSYRLMYRHRRLPYVGLPNILAGEFIVPELLQDAATPENLAQAMLNLLADQEVQERMRARFSAIRAQLRRDAANSAARAIQALVGRT